MKFDFKTVYWLVLVVAFTIILIFRAQLFLVKELSGLDQAIVAIWVILLLLPIIKEASIFGVSIKSELEKTKAEISEKLTNIRLDLITTISANNQFSPQININQPPKDSEMPKVYGQLQNWVKERKARPNLSSSFGKVAPPYAEPPADVKYLMEARYNAERVIKEIFRKTQPGLPIDKMNINNLVTSFMKTDLFDPAFSKILKDFYAICSEAIHGEQVSREKVDFVKSAYPEILSTLKEIESSL